MFRVSLKVMFWFMFWLCN